MYRRVISGKGSDPFCEDREAVLACYRLRNDTYCTRQLPPHYIFLLFFFIQDDLEMMLLTFIFCHLLGMSSASINPILYGYLNESFRKEFMDILQPICWWKTETTEAAAGGGAHQMGNGRTAEGQVEASFVRGEKDGKSGGRERIIWGLLSLSLFVL